MAVFNDGAMIALSKDRVTPSRLPNSWNLHNIFIMGIVYGLYLTISSWTLYQVGDPLHTVDTMLITRARVSKRSTKLV